MEFFTSHNIRLSARSGKRVLLYNNNSFDSSAAIQSTGKKRNEKNERHIFIFFVPYNKPNMLQLFNHARINTNQKLYLVFPGTGIG